MPATGGEAVAEVARRLMAKGIAGQAATDGVAEVERAVRHVFREELAAIRNLAFQAAFNSLLAARAVRTLWVNPPDMWPLSEEEAENFWGELRKYTAGIMRRRFEVPEAQASGQEEEDET